MREALREGKRAMDFGDIPIGAVIVKDGKIIGRGHNQKEKCNDATMHGEIIAMRQAAAYLGHWWLEGCTMYVTLEPCAMCAGAIVNTRLDKVVIGAKNPRFGACGSAVDLLNGPTSNHKVETEFGVLEEEAAALLSGFFAKIRKNKDL